MIFGRRKADRELDDEIRDYIERETLDNMASGLPPAAARQAAQRKFGRPVLNVKEDTRAVWGWTWFERLAQDLRHGARLLRRTPGFTIVAVLSLAVGIGVNSAIFSLADALLMRPLPVPRPGDVMTIKSITPDGSGNVSYRDYIDLRDHSRSFAGIVGFVGATFGLSTRPDSLPQMKMGMLVTGNFFDALRVQLELGRGFLPGEDQVPGRDAVLVLSHELWATEFASDPAVLGRKVRLSGNDFTVVGVAPEQFGPDLYFHPALYVPMMMASHIRKGADDHLLEARGQRELTVKGRLLPGTSLDQARAELQVIAGNLAHSYPVTNRNVGITVSTEIQERMRQDPVDSQLSEMLLALAAAVLLVACANVAALLLSRAHVRSREIALRLCIGAGRARIVRQLLTESLLIAIAGGICGLGIAYAGVSFFHRIEIPTELPIRIDVQLDHRVLWVSFAASLLSAILFGLAPALQSTRLNLVGALKTAGADTPAGRRRLVGRNVLVVGQVTVSMVLLFVTSLLFHGFRTFLGPGPGYRLDHLLMMSFDPTLLRYSDEQARLFFTQVVDRARSVTGVKSAALVSWIPMGADRQDGTSILPEGFQLPRGKESMNLLCASIDDQYFATMRIPLLRGRPFRSADTPTSPRIAIVNEEVAKHYWPGQDPVGKRFRLDNREGPLVEIVGLAKIAKYTWPGESPTEFVYFPFTQHPSPTITLLAESYGDPKELAVPMRDMVRTIDPNQPIYNVRTMEDYYQKRAVANPYMIVETVGGMGLIGLMLSLIGLYGLVAYTAGRRTREIGIRMAIGAQRSSVLRLVMRHGLILACLGIGLGLALSVGAERVVNSIFSLSGTDWPIYLLVAPALLAVTLLAAYIPARRASRVDPMKALRYE